MEVRLIYDDMGIFSLPRDYNEQLAARGHPVPGVQPLCPVMSLRLNNRGPPEAVMIIDGKVGFTGGINLADKLHQPRERFGHWKDSAILLEGTRCGP